jgi:transcriptional regulator with XRE-family HTH domain
MSEDSFGTRTRRLRERNSISQVALAKLLRVSKLSVWKWERRGVIPHPKTVRALANTFGVTERFLLEGVGDYASTAAEASIVNSLTQTGFQELIAECKVKIATHLGTTPEKVEITVNL